MGKARVTDNLGEGQYDFELIYSDERAQARIAQIQAKLDQIDNVEIVKLQADLITAQADVDAQADALDDAIANWVSAGTWDAGTDYTIGTRLRISGFATMLCEQSGRSGGIVPVWPDKHGDTIRENHVIWSASLSETSITNWSSNTDYVADDEVTLAINFEFVIDNPETGGGHFEHLNGTATRSGRSGNFEPIWIKGENVEGGVIWRREDNAQAIIEASKELRELAFLRDKAQAALNVVKTRKLSLEREKAWIENHLPDSVLKVAGWCADYSPDIAIDTEVETAEVTGFHHGGLTSAGKASDRTVLIRPQEPPADYPPEVMDPATGEIAPLPEVPAGKLRHAVACTAAECLYAVLVEPGAEKWRPTWRVGVINSIDRDADTCNVTLLFADAPRYSDLPVQHNINETVVLTDVPIRYMSCNAAAFEIGDRVLIEYAGQDRSFPTVRGFETNPRVCPGGFICRPRSDSSILPYTILTHGGASWRVRESNITQSHNISWIGPNKKILAWSGPFGRDIAPKGEYAPTAKPPYNLVRNKAGDGASSQHYQYQRFDTSLYVSFGNLIAGPGDFIVGAGLSTIDGIEYIFCITTDNRILESTGQDKFWRKPKSDLTTNWEFLASWDHPAKHGRHETGWRFNRSGTEARCILREYAAGAPLGYVNEIAEFTRQYKATISATPSVSQVSGASTPLKQTFSFDDHIDLCTSDPIHSYGTTNYINEGSEIVAVDYDGDTVITASLSDDYTESKTFDHFAPGAPNNTMNERTDFGGGMTLSMGATSVDITEYMGWIELDASSGGGSRLSDRTERFASLIYLDLRFQQILYFWRERDWTASTIYSGGPEFTYSSSQTVNRTSKIRWQDFNILVSNSDNQTTGSEGNGSPFDDFLCGSDGDVSDTQIIKRIPHIAEDPLVNLEYVLATTPAAIESNGLRFASVDHDIDPTGVLQAGYSNFLDDGNPVSLTGLGGANPRFYPIVLA